MYWVRKFLILRFTTVNFRPGYVILFQKSLIYTQWSNGRSTNSFMNLYVVDLISSGMHVCLPWHAVPGLINKTNKRYGRRSYLAEGRLKRSSTETQDV
jgi:hypothetical protein